MDVIIERKPGRVTRKDGKPFDSWVDYCDAPPPYGLGIPHDIAEALIAEKDPDRRILDVVEAVKAEIEASSRERTQAAAANPETGKVLAAHRHKEADKLASSQSDRAGVNGVGVVTQRKLDALARHAPDLLEEVKAGRMSAHAAALKAGLVKQPCPVKAAMRAVGQMNSQQRAEFMDWLTGAR